MFQDRKEYRKNFNAEGQLFVGGETLQLNCYDVSLKGAMVEVSPGDLLTTIQDFEALLNEDRRAEIFVAELMLAGEVDIVWVKRERNRIMMGMEFRDVVHNAHKLWRKRRGYRKLEAFKAELFIDKERFSVEGVNRSVEGMCLKLTGNHPCIKINAPVKLLAAELGLSALGKVVWVESNELVTRLGLQLVIVK
ncbi:PilZ domain-containing protein [Methylomonas sp. MO1]|uniref:PilZ domain-containing protein n=1 Tax=unclassified Methylomonas TaxID=2608980 RepID=UPI000479EEB3|nr:MULTISPECIES: PilZ domain-containing protein [unclassified Methylomonas]MDT4291759.1 PilZ domain-containing protein [Methylomonas sp. MO1]